jgi:hypothetical protein
MNCSLTSIILPIEILLWLMGCNLDAYKTLYLIENLFSKMCEKLRYVILCGAAS